MEGRLAEAEQAFREMLAVGQQMNNLWTTSTALVELGAVLRLLGRLEDASTIFRAGLDAIQQAGSGGLGFAGRLEAFLASILCEQNQLEEARRLAAESVAHNSLWGNPNHVAFGYWIQARILFGSGDDAAAGEAFRQAETVAAQPAVIPTLKASIQGLRVRLWLASNQISEAVRWVANTLRLNAEYPHPQSSSGLNIELAEIHILVHARVLIAQGNSAAAYQLLESLEASARAGDRNNTLIETLTLKALAAPNQTAGLDALNSALKLGIPHGYRRVYLDEGQALKPLLESLRGRSDLVERLLEPAARKSLVLTGREIEILHAMADGLSNKEIGARLYISAGTVKAHSAAIYRKLDAVNRTEAIAKAKDLGLL
jgi:LuxR family maltose regulon positive regulatory protein